MKITQKVTEYKRESSISPYALCPWNCQEKVEQADFPAIEVVKKREIQGELVHTVRDGSISLQQ